MRKQGVNIPEVKAQALPDIITQKREYMVITPLFGGGAVKGECDELTIIRGTEIRGHLRFWWRACYGGRYGSVKEMKEAEDRIWGTAAKPEKKEEEKENEKKDDAKPDNITVQISVEVLKSGTEIEPFPILNRQEYQKRTGKETKNWWESPYNAKSDIPSYAAFTLQLTNDEKKQRERPARKLLRGGVEFRLTLSFPEGTQHDVEGALWAWETFGGIGARTRRGFGALQRLTKIDGEDTIALPPGDNPMQWLQERIAALQAESKPPVTGKAPKDVPCLSPEMKMRYIGPFNKARDAWNGAIERLLGYRQYPNGREKDNRGKPYGRTKWPEAETIRILAGKKVRNNLSPPQKFPRAVFGLPIIFNFLKEDSDLQKRPLQGKEKSHDRLASPVLLRPLVCKSDDDKKDVVIGLAIVLENFSFPPEGIVFVAENGTPHPADPFIEDDDLDRITPLWEKDVLNDFIHYFDYVGGNE